MLLVFSLTSFSQSREQDYLRQTQGHYIIIYCPEDAGVVADLWRTLSERIPAVEQQLGLSLADTVRFVITPTQKEWFRVTAGAPLWANGIAFPDRGAAVLKSPRFGLPYGPLPVTAIHEYVHLLLRAGATGADFPRWFDEGIAQLLAGQMSYIEQTTLARAAASNRLHSLSRLEMLMAFNDNEAKQGYAESLIAVEFLRDRYGWSGISNLVHIVRQGKPFDETFAKIFGKSLGDFQSEYLLFVNQTYKTTIFADTELWFAVLVILMITVGGFALWFRRRKKLAQWQEEEEAAQEQSDSEPPQPPYIINYEIIHRNKQQSGEEEKPKDEDSK